MEVGDLIWTRDPANNYLLGCVRGQWTYLSDPDSCAADIVNTIPVDLIEIGSEARVAGSIIASFRAPIAIQRIRSESALLFSKEVYGAHTENRPISRIDGADVFNLVSDCDLEDVLYVMFQREGWVVFPNGRRADTMAYEFVMKRVSDGAMGILQTKTGQSAVDLDALELAARDPGIAQAFAFQPNGHYRGSGGDKVSMIDRGRVLDFMRANSKVLPEAVVTWMRVAGM